MAKIFKISGYFIDTAGSVSPSDILNTLTDKLSLLGRHVHISTKEIRPFDDNTNALNDPNCDLAICDSFFEDEYNWAGSAFADMENDDKLTIAPGQFYRHFKGKVVKVIAISQDTENIGSYYVVYEDPDGKIWHRPLSMFLSEVDHKKYPNVKQKRRFEQIDVRVLGYDLCSKDGVSF